MVSLTLSFRILLITGIVMMISFVEGEIYNVWKLSGPGQRNKHDGV